VALETTLVPRPPYWLALSARMKSDATRFFRDGLLTMVFETGGQAALARVRQLPDGSLAVSVESSEPRDALAKLRFVLAVDDDHTEFLDRFASDPLLGPAVRELAGLRPLRTATVSHALLKGLCGQLIQAKAARLLEAKLLRLAAPEHQGLRLPPTRETFARFAPAQLARHGLVSRKATALVRLSRELDLERLRLVRSDQASARLERERGLGPWTAGMVALYGLGRFDRGLVGDLGLVKLCSGLRGRWADADDTRELLEPYAEWAGLASVYLLARFPKRRSARPEAMRIPPARKTGHTGAPVNGKSPGAAVSKRTPPGEEISPSPGYSSGSCEQPSGPASSSPFRSSAAQPMTETRMITSGFVSELV
jgi:3-methyladenine DNA glycosylase/8-oxoguanine DNA glycosylase